MEIDLEIFKYLINKIKSNSDKRLKIGEFMEEYLLENSFCCFTFGTDLEDVLINLLADYFKCWWSKTGENKEWYKEKHTFYDNDISWWLYEDSKKCVHKENGVEITYDLEDIEDFYNYLTKNLTKVKNM